MIDHDNLEEFEDAESYDAGENDTGVAFYSALARETGGLVLELACGTGRVGIPVARLGFAVTGLDVVPGMLEQARRKSRGLSARWVEGDARAFDLHERFRLIFLTGNAFQLFLTRALSTFRAICQDCVHDNLPSQAVVCPHAGVVRGVTRAARGLTRAGPGSSLCGACRLSLPLALPVAAHRPGAAAAGSCGRAS